MSKALLLHYWICRQDAVHDTPGIDIQDIVKVLNTELLKRTSYYCTGIVENVVKTAVFLHCRLHHFFHLLGIAHVNFIGLCLDAPHCAIPLPLLEPLSIGGPPARLLGLPFWASSSARAWPMPDAPPLTMTTAFSYVRKRAASPAALLCCSTSVMFCLFNE